MSHFHLASAALGLALVCLLAGAAPARAADRFYEGLLRDGTLAYDRGDFAVAVRDLRLACFGLLEEPQPLAGCLVRLALAQAGAADARGFEETFRRIVEVEERFGAYAKANLPPELRAAFEAKVVAALPVATLEATPAFAPLVVRKLESQLAALPPRQRRKELESRIAREPRSFTLNLLLAELDLQEGQAAAALPRAEQAAALQPANPRARCLRGLARARSGRCGDAIADLEACPERTRRPEVASALAGCQAQAPPAAAQPIRQTPAPADPPLPAVPAVAPAAAPGVPGAPGVSSRPPAAAGVPQRDSKTARAREILDKGSPRDLKRALQLAREAAEASPGDREVQLLAAEAAYRNARWGEAVQFFKRAGDPGDSRPELLFYLAVSYFESGDRTAAAAVLRRALPNLKHSEYVDDYTRKILGAAGK